MSTAIAIRSLRLVRDDDYEPVSAGSREIQQTWQRERHFLTRSASDWLPSIEAALRGIEVSCRVDNWDGEDAIAVADRTIELAAKIGSTLFALLPKGTPTPDLMPESDGEICFSWSVDATRMFSLSVGEHGRVNFAGQYGTEGSIHAWQPIDQASGRSLEEALEDVVRYVSRLYQAPAIRRAA